jgi:predicted aldo/keto reductase-like oxidoreductase
MRYRAYGATGQISALGFGCMRLPEFERGGKWYVDEEKTTEMLRRAAALGVNYFDTGAVYCHRNSEAAVGKALQPIRKNVLVSTKLPIWDVKATGDYRRWLERSLAALRMDYVDYYHFWTLDRASFDEKVVGLGLLDEARKAKEEGLVRHISFSFHDVPGAIRHIIDRGERFETMLVQYNLLDRSNEEMIAYAAEKGLGVAAMGPVGGGRLAAPKALQAGGNSMVLTYELALKFVLGNPNISCALSGMETMEMLLQNVALASDEAVLSPAEWRQIGESLEQLRRFSDLYCTGCAYCQPCPRGIDIPKLFSAYTHYHVYGLPEDAKRLFAEYLERAAFQNCSGCGACEAHCPQKLSVRRELQRVEEFLSGQYSIDISKREVRL